MQLGLFRASIFIVNGLAAFVHAWKSCWGFATASIRVNTLGAGYGEIGHGADSGAGSSWCREWADNRYASGHRDASTDRAEKGTRRELDADGKLWDITILLDAIPSYTETDCYPG
jgi:hypothetical protein